MVSHQKNLPTTSDYLKNKNKRFKTQTAIYELSISAKNSTIYIYENSTAGLVRPFVFF